jgi:uncharacterized protein (TIGR02996 family)
MSSSPRPEVRALLEGVKSHPEDDVPRLILGDWLAERGDPRGEFLHVQCRLAASAWGDPYGDELARRQRELLTAHAATWTGSLASYILDRHFRRGLLWVNMRADRLVEAGRAGLGATEEWAWVEVLTLRELALVHLVELRDCGPLASPSSLNLRGSGVGNSFATLLANSPHLGRLHELQLGSCRVGSEGLAALARSEHLRHLRKLDLGGNHVGDDGVVALAASPLLARLDFLDLGDNRIGDRGARALADSPHLSDKLRLLLHRATIDRATQAALRERLGKRVSV